MELLGLFPCFIWDNKIIIFSGVIWPHHGGVTGIKLDDINMPVNIFEASHELPQDLDVQVLEATRYIFEELVLDYCGN